MNKEPGLKNVKIRKPMIMVKDFSAITAPEASILKDFLNGLKADKNVLIIADTTAPENQNLVLAAKELDDVKVVLPEEMKSSDLLAAGSIIVTEMAIASITERLSK